jgi:hypothetical protein
MKKTGLTCPECGTKLESMDVSYEFFNHYSFTFPNETDAILVTECYNCCQKLKIYTKVVFEYDVTLL